MNIDQLLEMEFKLHPSRLKHIYGVRDRAVELGKLYHADLNVLELAALLHDLCKYWPVEKQIEMIEDPQIISTYSHIPVCYHGFAASAYAKKVLKIDNPKILEAISYHMWGKIGMHLETMILATADYCEPNRKFPSANLVYQTSLKDIQKGFIESLEYTIYYLEKDQIKPEAAQREVLAYYKEQTCNY